MNTLKFYPKKLREAYIRDIRNSNIKSTPEKFVNNVFLFSIIFTVIASTIFFLLNIQMYFSILAFLSVHVFVFFKISLSANARIKKMETVFPEVISLMASNLKSGMTIDKAFMTSARPEFAPLDEEILKTGKDISTGQDIIYALKKMSDRIKSEKIARVVMLIISGLKAGGNISDLLEQTAGNMKSKEILEKKSRSTILMYVIFIFFAVSVGAPVLFALSSVLVEIVIALTAKIPDVASTQMDLPFTFNEINISLNFVIYFSIFFIIVSDFVSSMVLGLVRKGNSKEGLKYFLPLLGISLTLFFVVRSFLAKVLMEAIINI